MVRGSTSSPTIASSMIASTIFRLSGRCLRVTQSIGSRGALCCIAVKSSCDSHEDELMKCGPISTEQQLPGSSIASSPCFRSLREAERCSKTMKQMPSAADDRNPVTHRSRIARTHRQTCMSRMIGGCTVMKVIQCRLLVRVILEAAFKLPISQHIPAATCLERSYPDGFSRV